MRIAAITLLTASSFVNAAQWEFKQSTDPMTDVVSSEIMQPSNQDPGTVFYVSCKNKETTEQLIITNKQILSRYLDVRIGDFKSNDRWYVSNLMGGSGAFSPTNLRLRERMVNGGVLKIRYTTPGDTQIIDFNLEGFKDSYQKLKQSCK